MTSLKKEENAVQSIDNLDESEDKEKKAFFKRKILKINPKKHVRKKKVLFYFVTGSLLLAGLSLYPL
jgi:hypothetical protein